MSALPPSKKKKLIRIIIIIASLAQTALDNEIENSAAEQIMELFGNAKPILFDVPENEWNTDQEYAWTRLEAIHDAYAPEVMQYPGEQQLQSLCDDLADVLERC